MRRFLLRLGWAIGLREWVSCSRIRPEMRVRTVVFLGVIIAPFSVFVLPVIRLYWLITGRRLPRPLGLLDPAPHVFVNSFADYPPPEIRQLLERPEYNWEPGPRDIPPWFNVWIRVTQALFWQMPTGVATPQDATPRAGTGERK